MKERGLKTTVATLTTIIQKGYFTTSYHQRFNCIKKTFIWEINCIFKIIFISYKFILYIKVFSLVIVNQLLVMANEPHIDIIETLSRDETNRKEI